MRRCGETHPDYPVKVCIQPEGRHADHADKNGTTWVNPVVVEEMLRAPKRRPGQRRGRPSPEGVRTVNEIASHIEPEQRAGKRSFNLASKVEGMDAAATSMTSEKFRTTFFLAMAEVATRQEILSTNDAWDLLESRGFTRAGSAQSAGTVGRSGVALGLWEATAGTIRNTSGNLHSADNEVRVYRSLVVGRDFEADIAPQVVEKAAARGRAVEV